VTGDGLISSRLLITWTAPDYPYIDHYIVEIFEGSTSGPLAFSGPAYSASFTSPALPENKTYMVGVTVRSSSFATSTRVTAAKALVGKTALPSNVSGFVCIEAGGKVYAHWDAATDDVDPTICYELRYGAVGVAWADATYLQRLTALGYTVEGIPVGVWDFLIKARDSYRLYSSAATVASSVNVTQDPSATALGFKLFTTPTLVDMTKYTIGSIDYWVTNNDDGWGYGHNNTDNAVGTFNDVTGDSQVTYPFARKTSATVSSWESNAWDLEAVQAVTVTASFNVTALYGTAKVEIGYSTNGSTYFWSVGTTFSTVARYIKLRASIASSGVLLVTGPVTATALGVTRYESGTTTSSSAGGVTVLLASNYTSYKSIHLTPQSATAALIPAYDRVMYSPETGLMLRFTQSGTGGVIQRFSTASYLIVSGDKLMFDFYLPPNTVDTSATMEVT
jgi:hypothetical protein